MTPAAFVYCIVKAYFCPATIANGSVARTAPPPVERTVVPSMSSFTPPLLTAERV